MKCPKCNALSGDDWSQCGGSCPMSMSPHYQPNNEGDLSKKIQELAVKFKCKLLRNNSGAMKDKTGRHVRYGLGNISKKLWDKWKTSDQIGYTKVVITPDMVGRTVAIFTAVEVKLPDSPIDDRYRAQEKFINQVKVDGGIAAIIKSIDEIEDLFNSYFTRS